MLFLAAAKVHEEPDSVMYGVLSLLSSLSKDCSAPVSRHQRQRVVRSCQVLYLGGVMIRCGRLYRELSLQSSICTRALLNL